MVTIRLNVINLVYLINCRTHGSKLYNYLIKCIRTLIIIVIVVRDVLCLFVFC